MDTRKEYVKDAIYPRNGVTNVIENGCLEKNMTEDKFRRQIDIVLELNNKLIGQLGILSIMASEVLGEEYNADLCNGDEIEFRPVDEYGFIDDGIGPNTHSTKYEEDIIRIIRGE